MSDNDALLQVVEMLERAGIRTKLYCDGQTLAAFFENGFYKSDGFAYLKPQDGHLYLFARYGEKTEIKSLADVAKESKHWHKFSRERSDKWESPSDNWGKLYSEYCA